MIASETPFDLAKDILDLCGDERERIEVELAMGVIKLHGELAAARAELDAANDLLREWLNTELDSMDEEFQPWIDSFTARIKAALAAERKS